MTRSAQPWRAPILVIALVAALMMAAGCGSEDDASSGAKGPDETLQTVSFQKPQDPGANPFTEAADVKGEEEVELPKGQGPFGGTGSNRVCDRDLLIRFLRKNPDRMREWARVQGLPQNIRAVTEYIAKLHPVTLTRDTQVTNHNFVGGRAVGYQAILQAGTAVLVDKYGVPVARCRCGNPLKPAVFVATAKCRGCPPNYHPPRPCAFGRNDDYDDTYYRRTDYDNGEYDEVFVRRHRNSPYRDCYEAYPDPPTVTIVDVFEPPKAEPAQEEPPPPPPADDGVLNCDAPQSQLEFEQCRDQQSQDQQPPHDDGGVNCDAPQSQLEAEQCAAAQGNAPENTPVPTTPSDGRDPNYECPDFPPAHPGEDYLRNCG